MGPIARSIGVVQVLRATKSERTHGMTRTLDLLLGVLSVEPLAFFAVFFFWLLPSFGRSTESASVSIFRERFHMLVPFAIVSAVLLLILMLVYIIVLARRPDLSVGEKIGVPIGIFVTNGIVLPLIWWFYVWRRLSLNAFTVRRAL
jgi:hypothetical protein